MANVGSVTKHWPVAKEGFTTTSASTIGSGAATVPLNSVTGYTNGDTVVMVIEPGNATNKQAFTGVIDTAGVQVTSVVWTEGTNTTHTAGSTVVDYVAATHMAMITKGLKVSHEDDGTLKTTAVRTALGLGAGSTTGWEPFAQTFSVASGYNKGNKEFEITASADVSSFLSAGMRIKLNRATTPPTQCADLESSSSQYASKTTPAGLSFTDDFTCEGWVRLESYTLGIFVARMSGVNGFQMYINASGQLVIYGGSGGASDNFTTYQALPLNQWVHVAATMDMSAGASTAYINGASVPGLYTSGAPTSITQGGDLRIGNNDGANYLDGKIADVRVWSVVRTATQIRDNMNQQLVGNETNLVAYFKLDGNFNDSTSNANNLTASGGAVATNVDNPMKATEYAIVTKVATTTVTVFAGTDYNIPNMTLSAAHYSPHKTPFGFPSDSGKWRVETLSKTNISTTSASLVETNLRLTLPLGEWKLRSDFGFSVLDTAATGDSGGEVGLSTATTSASDMQLYHQSYFNGASSANLNLVTSVHWEKDVSLTVATTYYLISKIVGSTSTSVQGAVRETAIVAECSYA